MRAMTIPKEFVWKRLHSLMGLWLVLFLCEHLLVNSQAALWLGENGRGFIEMVNSIHNLPYLQAIEIGLLGFPIALHMFWGVRYLLTARSNSGRSDGTRPSIRTNRNRAYTWQRVTSWILLFCLIGHVVKFRFLQYPDEVSIGGKSVYLSVVRMDDRLYPLTNRLGVTLYDEGMIARVVKQLDERKSEQILLDVEASMSEEHHNAWEGPIPKPYQEQQALITQSAENYRNTLLWAETLQTYSIDSGRVLATASDFGTITLLIVRDTFKRPIYVALYTIFVLAACYHAWNGVWTFLLTWGLILKASAQRACATLSAVFMAILIFLGLAAIWGSYWGTR